MELVPEAAWAPPTPDPARPDVVIMTAADEALVGPVEQVLWQWPTSRVLLIRLDGHDAVLYELRVTGERLGDVSPRELIDAIRTAVRQRAS